MIRVGITGNIGSGKTLSSMVFNKLGIPVFEADQQAKALYMEQEIKAKMSVRFGDQIYFSNGQLNKKKLADILFNDPKAVSFVNNLIHPAVRQKFSSWVDQQTNCPYILYEAAILFETGYYKQLDYNILVVAPAEIRIKRVMERDHVGLDAVKKRMQYQWSDEQKKELSDFIIKNDNENLLIPQVLAIHRNLLAKTGL